MALQPLPVELIAYAPTQFYHCEQRAGLWKAADVSSVKKRHADMLETAIPPEMLQDYRSLSERLAARV